MKKNKAIEKLSLVLKEKESLKNEQISFLKKIKSPLELNLSENIEENNFLLDKTRELLTIQANASLELGKIFKEVEEKIQDKTYCNWLNLIGYNRVTAFRHKRRYTLFLEAKTEKAKEIVGLLTFRELETFYKNYEENLTLLNSDEFTLKHFKRYLIEVKQQSLIEVEANNNEEIFNIFNKELIEKIDKMDNSKKNQIEKLMKEIIRLINL